jgi:hypothetical protein
LTCDTVRRYVGSRLRQLKFCKRWNRHTYEGEGRDVARSQWKEASNVSFVVPMEAGEEDEMSPSVNDGSGWIEFV